MLELSASAHLSSSHGVSKDDEAWLPQLSCLTVKDKLAAIMPTMLLVEILNHEKAIDRTRRHASFPSIALSVNIHHTDVGPSTCNASKPCQMHPPVLSLRFCDDV